MFKLKTLLLLSILPLAYLIYHLIGFENGINAYVHKIKVLKNMQIEQEELKKEINYYKTKKICFLGYFGDGLGVATSKKYIGASILTKFDKF